VSICVAFYRAGLFRCGPLMKPRTCAFKKPRWHRTVQPSGTGGAGRAQAPNIVPTQSIGSAGEGAATAIQLSGFGCFGVEPAPFTFPGLKGFGFAGFGGATPAVSHAAHATECRGQQAAQSQQRQRFRQCWRLLSAVWWSKSVMAYSWIADACKRPPASHLAKPITAAGTLQAAA